MATTRDGVFTLVDYSGDIQLIPRVHSLLTDLNLVSSTSMVETTVAQVERVTDISPLMKGSTRGGNRAYVGGEQSTVLNFNIPFFSLDRQFRTADIQNFRKYGEVDAPKTLQDEVIKAMARARRSKDQTFEKALAAAVQGQSYGFADVGLPEYNYYTQWGVTQSTANIDFTSATAHPAEIIETQARAAIIDKANDNGNSYRVIALCGRQWFNAFVTHNDIEVAYQYYSSDSEPLRKRLGGDAINRMFDHDGVLYIEDISGNIPTGQAFIFPLGIERMFEVFYAPSDDAKLANEMGQELYLYYKEDNFNRQYKLECESSFLIVNNRPELVVKSVGTF